MIGKVIALIVIRLYCCIRKERKKYLMNFFVGMDPFTMWSMLRRSGYIKRNDSPFRFGAEEMNDHFAGVSNSALPVDSEPWTNLNFYGPFSFSCVSCQGLSVVLHSSLISAYC